MGVDTKGFSWRVWDPIMNNLDREILKIAAQPGLCREARAMVLAAGATQAGKVSLEHAVKMLMEPDMPGINLPCPEGAEMGAELARLVGECPGQCDTCGFKAGTVPNQSPTTVTEALDCAMTGAVFLCHDDGKPCRAWKKTQETTNPRRP